MGFIEAGSVPNGKSFINPIPATANVSKYLQASEWNSVMGYLLDIRTAIINGNYFGFAEAASAPTLPDDGSTSYLWAKDDGNLVYRRDSANSFIGAAGVTTKGDLIVFNGTGFEVLAAGSANQVLTVDSGESSGLKWADNEATDTLGNLGSIKGDVAAFSGSAWSVLPAGTNGYVLKADSAQSLGLRWAADNDTLGGLGSIKGDVAVFSGSAWSVLPAGTDGYVLRADSAQTLGVKWDAEEDPSVTTIANLRASSAYTTNAIIYVQGYYAANDGGGGLFIYDSASTATDDSGVTIKPTAVSGAGRWIRQINEGSHYNVRWYGAKGDGSTDDASAIQAALDKAAAQGVTEGISGKYGAIVYFPSGKYKCTSGLNVRSSLGIKMVGEAGRVAANNGVSSIVYTGGAIDRFLDARSTFAFEVRDLDFHYTNSAFIGLYLDTKHSPDGINAGADTSYFIARGCNFSGGGTVASCHAFIALGSTIFANIEDCHFSYGMQGIRGAELSDYSNNVTITNCVFDNLVNYTESDGTDSIGAAILNAGENWSVKGCAFEGGNGGFGRMLRAYYVDLPAGNGLISRGLSFEGCWFGDAGDGFWIEPGTGTLWGFGFVNNHMSGKLKLYSLQSENGVADGGTAGACIFGNSMDEIVWPGEDQANHAAISGVTITGNKIELPIVNFDSSTCFNNFIFGNSHFGAGFSDSGQVDISGHIKTTPLGNIVARKARGNIKCVTKANLVDGETVTIGSTIFEFDVAGDGVGGGNVQVDVSTDTTATQVATRLKTAIEGQSLGLTGRVDDNGALYLSASATGSAYNYVLSETVANSGFYVNSMIGGSGASTPATAITVVTAGAGTGATATFPATNTGRGSNDICGAIRITSGTGATTGSWASVRFARDYKVQPRLFLQPRNQATKDLEAVIVAGTTANPSTPVYGFRIFVYGIPDDATQYDWDYFVIE